MGRFQSVIKSIVNQASLKKGGSRPPRLPKGRHLVAFRTYRGKDSEMNAGIFFYGSFEILQTETVGLNPGDVRDWAWFPSRPSWSGKHEQDRMKDYLLTMVEAAKGLGDTRTDEEIVDAIDDNPGQFAGLQLLVDVREATKPKTGEVVMRKNKDGKDEVVYNSTFSVPQQNLEIFQALNGKINAEVVKQDAEREAHIASQQAAPRPAFQTPAFQAPAPVVQPVATGQDTNPLQNILNGFKK